MNTSECLRPIDVQKICVNPFSFFGEFSARCEALCNLIGFSHAAKSQATKTAKLERDRLLGTTRLGKIRPRLSLCSVRPS